MYRTQLSRAPRQNQYYAAFLSSIRCLLQLPSAIRVTGNRVAEISSVHWNAEAARPDERDFRSLKEYGHYDQM